MGLNTYLPGIGSATTSGVIIVAAACAGIFGPQWPQLSTGIQNHRLRSSESRAIAESAGATQSTQSLLSVSAVSLDGELAIALYGVFQKLLKEEHELDSRAKEIFYEGLPDMYRQ